MSDTTGVTSDVSTAQAPEAAGTRRRRGSGLSAMLLPELQSLAASLGISGTARMRKGELIAAIEERQGAATAIRPREQVAARAEAPREEVHAGIPAGETEQPSTAAAGERAARRATRAAGPPEPREQREPAQEEREQVREQREQAHEEREQAREERRADER
ncbi:MAG: Rho termination factor N-terminal domain-containing protein, partial [Dactylosporangium sp.]|nr:Rho termination factor N-terminal domain-containing protein [Dactylosporangium sp.]